MKKLKVFCNNHVHIATFSCGFMLALLLLMESIKTQQGLNVLVQIKEIK